MVKNEQHKRFSIKDHKADLQFPVHYFPSYRNNSLVLEHWLDLWVKLFKIPHKTFQGKSTIRLYPLQKNPILWYQLVSSLLLFCCDKTLTKNNLGEKVLIWCPHCCLSLMEAKGGAHMPTLGWPFYITHQENASQTCPGQADRGKTSVKISPSQITIGFV